MSRGEFANVLSNVIFINQSLTKLAMTTKIMGAGQLKAGSFVVLEGVACKVADLSLSKPGKHGAMKARIVAIGLIDGKKRDVVMPASENIEVPVIEKKGAQVLSVTGTVANVMDSETFETFDLEVPEDLRETVKEGVIVLYWNILNQKVMKQLKSGVDE